MMVTTSDLPIVAEPIEAQSNDNLPISVEPNEAEMENQLWFIKYGKELQGLVITDREIESHYYDIHTALTNIFLNESYAILILEGYMMALINEIDYFYLFDSHARDFSGMPNPNGTAVVMKFTNIIGLEQYLCSVSLKLHTNLFEIVPVQLNKCIASNKKRKQCEETDIDRQARLHKASETKKRKRLEETNSE
jgi:hypothetical protein